jgi:hypothetical protein
MRSRKARSPCFCISSFTGDWTERPLQALQRISSQQSGQSESLWSYRKSGGCKALFSPFVRLSAAAHVACTPQTTLEG